MTAPVTTEAPRSRFRLIVLVPVLALIALLAWAMASPIGSSPDDDFHLSSIWCATVSTSTADCQPGTSADTRLVPKLVAEAPCFAHKPQVSGTCQTKIGTSSKPDHLTTRVNTEHSYPPVYYATMHAFVSSNIVLSAFVIRVVNILLFLAITTALFLLLPRRRRPTLIWAWLITTLPLGLFLIASDNPSAWAIIGVGSSWLALLGYFETTGRRKVGLGVLFALASLTAAGSRGDSAVYTIVGIGAVLFLAFAPTRGFFRAAILPVVFAVISAVFFLTARQSLSGVTGFHGSAGLSTGVASQAAAAPVNPITLLFSNMVQIPSLWAGIFGEGWGLGWLDTSVPAVTSLGAIAVFVAVVFMGLGRLSLRKGIVVGLVGIVVWLLPAYVLGAGHDPVGQQVQPRYLLPLIILFAGLAVLRVRDRRPIRLGRVQWITLAATLSIGQCLALYFTMRRFINGNAPGGVNLDAAGGWWWSIPIPPIVVFALGSLAYAATVVVLLRELNGRLPDRGDAQTQVDEDADESLSVV
jgi:hypothetical protein